MDCKTCKERDISPISRGVFESVMARNDRMAKRLWIVIIILIFLFVGTNAYWIWYNSQWETEKIYQEVTQEAENGINRFVGGNYYGNETETYPAPEETDLLIIEDTGNEEGLTDYNYSNNEKSP